MPTFNSYTGDLYIDDGGYWDWTPLHIAANTTAAEERVIHVNTPIEKEVADYLLGNWEHCCEGDECQEKTMELQEVLGF